MRTNRGVRQGRRVAALLTLLLSLVVSCGDEETMPVVQVAPSPSGHAQYAFARDFAARNPTTPEEFRASNPMAWVGRVHNIFLREFFEAYTSDGARNPCASMVQAWEATRARVGADSSRLESVGTFRNRAAAQYGAHCFPEVVLRRASASPPPAPLAESATKGGDPQPYLDAIDMALQDAVSSGNLASILAGILYDAANSLTGSELDLVYSTASVAQDSYDYWVSSGGLAIEYANMEAQYSTCLTLADEPTTCFYDAADRRSSLGSEIPSIRTVSNTTSRQVNCGQFLDAKAVARADALGAATGFLAGGPAGAAANSVQASGMKAMQQIVMVLICQYFVQ